MSERELICIGCPMGCPIVVKMEDGKVTSVTGNTCPRGEAYARKEVTRSNPYCNYYSSCRRRKSTNDQCEDRA